MFVKIADLLQGGGGVLSLCPEISGYTVQYFTTHKIHSPEIHSLEIHSPENHSPEIHSPANDTPGSIEQIKSSPLLGEYISC